MKFLKPLALSALLLAQPTPFPAAYAAEPPAATANRDVSPAEAETLVTSKKVVVLDVRTPEEFAAGHIHGATNLNFYARNFQDELKQLDKSKPYLVHCAVGGRSSKAVDQMKRLGFTSIYHLRAGMKGWEDADKPVEKSKP